MHLSLFLFTLLTTLFLRLLLRTRTLVERVEVDFSDDIEVGRNLLLGLQLENLRLLAFGGLGNLYRPCLLTFGGLRGLY